MNETNFPNEEVKLPSKGLIYPEGHPLRSGVVQMKYMTAREEDILTNSNFIKEGTVLDKLLESLTFNKFPLSDMHPGDKNAILIAARILGLGKNYSFEYDGEEYTLDLTQFNNKPFDIELTSKGTTFFTLPQTGTEIEFKFLTEKELDLIDEEIQGFKKINKASSPGITTRLKHTIVSVGGVEDKNAIKNFVDNELLALDSRALRSYILDKAPDVDLKFDLKDGGEAVMPITLGFFWPEL